MMYLITKEFEMIEYNGDEEWPIKHWVSYVQNVITGTYRNQYLRNVVCVVA